MIAIVPTRRAADGSRVLGLPKGHIDGDETPLEAALREVREETGVVAELVDELGDVSYWYMRDGNRVPKTVLFFLFRYLSGDIADHDFEVEEVRFMPLEQAASELTYATEREMAKRAIAVLGRLEGGAGGGQGDREDGERGGDGGGQGDREGGLRGGGISNDPEDR